MTIDEITTALQEWRGEDDDKSYLLIAVEDDEVTRSIHGYPFQLGYGLADLMRGSQRAEDMVEFAMSVKQLNLFHIDDLNNLIDDIKNRKNR